MEIIQINTVDREGGAAKIASQLKDYLESQGNKVTYFVKIKHSSDQNTKIMPNDDKLFKALNGVKKFINRDIYSALQNHTIEITANDIEHFKSDAYLRTDAFNTADIIHFHNLHGNYFSLKSLIAAANKKPLIWTLHDMLALTGHCSHSFDCEKWKTGCGNCPYLKTYPALNWDNTKQLWNKKASIYQKLNIHIVSPSRWLDEKVSKSTLSHLPRSIIHNGIDTSVYIPYEKFISRTKLKLPIDKFIVMFLAYGGKKSEWKGGYYLERIMQKFADHDEYHFLCVGGSDQEEQQSNNKVTYIQKTNDPKLLSQYYSASDVFLFPSLAETFPLVVLEAMACGLPVVSFNVGGVKEALTHKEMGYIARYKDVVDLLKGIEFVYHMKKEDVIKMQTKMRNQIQNKFALDKMLQSYLNLYSKLGA
jgi:glycosyltransferase involved in cell wall biosynthesis